WDMSTGMPEKGIEERASLIAQLSTESFKMSISDEMKKHLDYFLLPEIQDQLSNKMLSLVNECKKDFDRFNKIPAEKYSKYVQLTSEAQSVWEKAKNKDDFSLFSPYLENIIQYNIEFTELWGYEGNRYNALLEYYEPGMTVKKLDLIFDNLRKYTISLLVKINNSEIKPNNSILKKNANIDKQKKVCRQLLEDIGFDFKAGRLDESEHPFTIGVNPDDVRITTHFFPENFSSAIFSCLHEGGHGLYEQNISKDLNGTPLCTGTSMGIHESQSRFWENIIGRSKKYWENYYELLKGEFPEIFNELSVEEFYKTINKVEPSLIRIESDELTYNLHIMIRYEIEKALINEEISVAELPEFWNDKVEEYLGIRPENDKEGVLQDVHWSAGLLGYFPSYSLGNIYAAQFYYTIKEEIKDFDDLVKNGDLIKIKEWLSDKIYKHGKLLSPPEIIQQVTGEESTSKYFIKYMNEKFTEIYDLK
ncbi:MAG: carboxypeptidase M32, partial [Bacillota bacterium]